MSIFNATGELALDGASIGLKDPLGRQGKISTFGKQYIGIEKKEVSVKFDTPLSSRDAVLSTPIGTGASNQNGTVMELISGGGAGTQELTSSSTISYSTGDEFDIEFTQGFINPQADAFVGCGFGDADSGLWVGNKDNSLAIRLRRSGVDYEAKYGETPGTSGVDPLADDVLTWIDPLDGTGKSGLNWSSNGFGLLVNRISLGFLGIATIVWEIVSNDGARYPVAKLDYMGKRQYTHLTKTNLPMSAFVETGAGAVGVTKLLTASWSATTVTGHLSTLGNREFPYITPNTPDNGLIGSRAIGASTSAILGAFYNKPTFGGTVNNVKAKLLTITIKSTANRGAQLAIYQNVTEADPGTVTYTDVDTDSVLQTHTPVTPIVVTDVSSAKLSQVFPVGTNTTTYIPVETLNRVLSPGNTASFIVTTDSAGAGDFSLAITWSELRQG